jgi:predicted oxidoreductase (fatty acid repression mutant protein)
MKKNFIETIKNRRSIYSINSESSISDEKIISLVNDAVKYVPSAFNSQSSRVVVLFGESHGKFWSIVMNTLRKIVPPENLSKTKDKIDAFAAGHGTILYFDNTEITNGLAKKFPLYSDRFKIWADHSNAMLQFTIWSLLEDEELGATLQHYNPIIDAETRKIFNIPETWRLIAQMPFGKPTAGADEKDFVPVSERVKILK